MPEERGYWGLEIGQAGLKALRIQLVEGAGKAVATNFDYVPHAKILSQPDAVPEELIGAALDTFLSRNDIRGDAIAISVPGQSALARFIQLPPVEQSKVAQIVTYEAKQQIPFPLEDVIWDYQTLGGGSEESGYLLEAEVGLFAMKRDLVMQQLRPLIDRKVEVELIQVAPLALYNFLCYDRLKIRPEEPFTPTNDYTVVCEMGTDNTILVVTNGAKIWIRNVPIGGNHFTRALVKDMKLTFAKAEHLKINATKSPDPKAVFQAMRPVFNDYVSEIQRSIGYFSSVNRDAKIVKVLGVGNGFKLAGLQKFLQQNLQYPVERVERFESLVGEKVLSDAVFQENIVGFVVPYGLAVQAMGETTIRTTLLPPEIATARKIRAKKPWAVLTAACLMAILTVSAFAYGRVSRSVSTERFGAAETIVANWNQEASGFKSRYSAVESRIGEIEANTGGLIGDVGTRELWLELMRAVNECLPRDTPATSGETDISKRRRIRISSLVTHKIDDPAMWFAMLTPEQKKYLSAEDARVPPVGKTFPGIEAASEEDGGSSGASENGATQGPYIVTIVGEHYFNGDSPSERGEGYVRSTLLRNLQRWVYANEGSTEPVPVGQLGISHAVIIKSLSEEVIDPRNFTEIDFEDDPIGPRAGGAGGFRRGGFGEDYTPEESYLPPPGRLGPAAGHGGGGGFGPAAGRRGAAAPPPVTLDQLRNIPRDQQDWKYPDPIERTEFTIQFVWRPIRPENRPPRRPAVSDEEAQAAQEAAEAASAAQLGEEGMEEY